MKPKSDLLAALQGIAAQCTILCQNVAADELTPEAARPESPLRSPEKFLELDPTTGVVTVNVDKFNTMFPSDDVINSVPFGSGSYNKVVG
jgi:hypothetical protein